MMGAGVQSKIEETKELIAESNDEANNIFDSALKKLWSYANSWQKKTVAELAKTVSGQIIPTSEPYASMPHINGNNIVSGRCKLLPYQTAMEDGVISGK